MTKINITSGESSKKEHLRNGSRTVCNRKTSGVGSNDTESFTWWANTYPDACCQKCLNRFNEKR